MKPALVCDVRFIPMQDNNDFVVMHVEGVGDDHTILVFRCYVNAAQLREQLNRVSEQ